MDRNHFLQYVIDPTFEYLESFEPRMVGDTSRALLLGTAMHESLLKWLHQRGGGPAVGVYQMEPDTHDWLWVHLRELRMGQLHSAVCGISNSYSDSSGRGLAKEMQWNLMYATAMARLRYWVRPEPLPEFTAEGLAGYHEVHYNTRAGAIGKTIDVLEAKETFQEAINTVETHPRL